MSYIAASVFMYLSHSIPSAPGVRGWLIARLGTRLFRTLYSVVSLAAIVWFVWAFSASELEGSLFNPAPGVIWIALVLIPFAIYLMVGRIGTPFGEMSRPVEARGVYLISRFPGSWGVLLWAVVHLAATGDLKRVIAFGTFALIAITALVKNELVVRGETSPEAVRFVDATGIIPFSRIVTQRQKFSMPGLGWKLPLISVFLFGLLLYLHSPLLDINPLDLIG